jgi:dienelactone hydrolase
MNKKTTRLFISAILTALIFGVVVFGFAIVQSRPAAESAIKAMQSDDQVQTFNNDDNWLVFTPRSDRPVVGFIFYPGGNVDPRAYAPLARQIAAAGYLVIIPTMPFDLAVFAPNIAAQVIPSYREIDTWVIGGHSLGGAMAAAYAADHPDQISGLVLWASYPADTNDLSTSALPVLSVYGTLDGVTSLEEIDSLRARLPADTRWAPIEGGNHAQFGDYGNQTGDNPAEISVVEQHVIITAETVVFLKQKLVASTLN